MSENQIIKNNQKDDMEKDDVTQPPIKIICPKCPKCGGQSKRKGLQKTKNVKVQRYMCKQKICSFNFYEGSNRKPYYEIKPEPGKKRCSICKLIKLIEVFPNQKLRKDGKSTTCTDCANYLTASTRLLKSLIMKLWSHGKVCCDCGCQDETVFHNDHINNDKSKTKKGKRISTLKANSLPKLMTELKKTEIVCANCHRQRTFKRTKLRQLKKPKNIPKIYNIVKKIPKKQQLLTFVNNEKMKIGGCLFCKLVVTQENPHVFDFDHINPFQKIDNISQMVSEKKDQINIEKEIKKCQLLCANCHMIKTRKQLGWKSLNDFTPEQINIAKQYIDGTKFTGEQLRNIFIPTSQKQVEILEFIK